MKAEIFSAEKCSLLLELSHAFSALMTLEELLPSIMAHTDAAGEDQGIRPTDPANRPLAPRAQACQVCLSVLRCGKVTPAVRLC